MIILLFLILVIGIQGKIEDACLNKWDLMGIRNGVFNYLWLEMNGLLPKEDGLASNPKPEIPLTKSCLDAYTTVYICLKNVCEKQCKGSLEYTAPSPCHECYQKSCQELAEPIGYKFPIFLSDLPKFYLVGMTSFLDYDEIISLAIDRPYNPHPFEEREAHIFPLPPTPMQHSVESGFQPLNFLSRKISFIFGTLSGDLFHPLLLAIGVCVFLLLIYMLRVLIFGKTNKKHKKKKK